MRALWDRLAATQKGSYQPDSAALAGQVAAALRAGDVIAVKGSLGSKMKTIVDAIVAASGGEAGC
jgi:UDP-N-acetylmuramoyl-tripeptide--D-alanyl-D-alanine ligase